MLLAAAARVAAARAAPPKSHLNRDFSPVNEKSRGHPTRVVSIPLALIASIHDHRICQKSVTGSASDFQFTSEKSRLPIYHPTLVGFIPESLLVIFIFSEACKWTKNMLVITTHKSAYIIITFEFY